MTAAPRPPARARQLFDEAMARDAAERAAFLANACTGDDALRREIEALLRLHAEAEGAFAEPTRRLGEQPGDRIDHYRLLQRIGEGGFGTVWMAEQERPVLRKVALKVIKAGMDSAQVIGRFEAERQALAIMDHPNIAKVFDGGTTPQGRPYFVMELVKGVPITKYCDEAGLAMAPRLELFVAVCQAVQHAHQKGVIHRDLKPNNVLVTLHDGKPVPKVIDFGIAKATQGRLTDKTVFTDFQQMLGTPEYMAPEQAELSGLDIDTRADIYSLGVLLYELLTGTRPFDLKALLQAGHAEMVRTIREVDPPKPSTRVSTLGEQVTSICSRRRVNPRSLGALMRGDLDWIVMKALEKERSRRYDSATALADDLLRHLQHEPVLAGPPSRIYRLRKYGRRHRGGVAATAAITLALAIGAVAGTLGYFEARAQTAMAGVAQRRAEEERTAAQLARAEEQQQKEAAQRAEAEAKAARIEEQAQRMRAEERQAVAQREATKSRHLVNLLQGMFLSNIPGRSKGKDYTVRQLLDDFSREQVEPLASEPEVALELRQTLAMSYLALGLPQRAEPHLEIAQSLVAGLTTPDPGSVARVAFLRALLLKNSGRAAEALAAFDALLQQHAGQVDELQVNRWRCHQAACAMQSGDPDTAIRLLEALAAELALRPGDQRVELARVQQFLGTSYGTRLRPGDLARSEEMARKALAIQQELLPPGAAETTASMGNLANALTQQGHVKEAGELVAEVLKRDIEHYGPEHPQVAVSRVILAASLWQRGMSAEAAPLLEQAVATHRKQPGSPMDLAFALMTLGNVYSALKRHAEAVAPLREAVEISCREQKSSDFSAAALLNLASVQLWLGKAAEGRQLVEQSLAMRIRLHGTDHLEVAKAQTMLGQLLLAYGDFAAAEKELQAAAATQRRDLSVTHPQLAVTQSKLADCLLRLGKDAAAARCAEAVLAAGRQDPNQDSPARLNMLMLLGAARWQLGEFDASAEAFEAVVEIQRRTLGAQHRETAMASSLLARVRLDQGREHAEAAEAHASAAVEALGQSPRAGDPEIVPVLVLRAEARSLLGRSDDAAADLQRALAICRAAGGAAGGSNATLGRAQLACGDYLLARGRASEAEPLLRASFDLLGREEPNGHRQWMAASSLGGAILELSRHAEAEPLLLQAQDKLPSVLLQPDGRARRQTVQRLVSLYERWGKPEAAADWRARLLAADAGR